MAPWADAIYACDARWWRVYGDEAVRTCAGELWSAFGAIGPEWDSVPERIRRMLHFIDVVEHEGLSTKAGRVSSGKNSGAQAIGLAYQWAWWNQPGTGILLGYDMQRTDNKTHWHGNHEGKLPNLGMLHDWRRWMTVMAGDLRDRGVRIINASRQTALTCFERMPIDEALR